MQSYGYIYLTTNSVNNIVYIGQSRGAFKKNYRGSGHILMRAIRKYGKDKFSTEPIEWCDSRDELNQSEKEHIAILRAFGAELYNLHPGGIGARDKTANGIERIRRAQIGRTHSPEAKAKMSAAKKGKPGHPMSPENKLLLVLANTGTTRSVEARDKMRAAKKGKPGHPISEEHKAKLLSVNKGKVHTEETKAKFSLAKRGKPWTAKRRAMFEEAKKNKEYNYVTI